MPILRGRQEEFKVLKTFNYEDRIYPCLEIIKEVMRKDPKPRKGSKNPPKLKKKKLFEDDYIPLIRSVNAKHVFVDLPVHLEEKTGMQIETLKFLRSVVKIREIRTEYIKKFIPLGPKVIPIISTYSEITGERGSISLQEKEIRHHFKSLAFRTFFKTFPRDISQIKELVHHDDYIIMDWGDTELDFNDGDQLDIIEELEKIDCNIITHRNSFSQDITMSGLDHCKIVDSLDNSLLDKYAEFAGSSFSDYAGIRKDNVGDGGRISPGFIFYDAVENNFYGYRYKNGSHKKNEKRPELKEFETTIVPAVISSNAVKRMQTNSLDYLGTDNKGWKIINNIELGESSGGESGKSAAKFKRISMLHYLHCLKTKISNGDFD
jgi:hypothetical protein